MINIHTHKVHKFLDRLRKGMEYKGLMNLAACGGTFLTGLIRQKYGGLTRLTRFSLYPEHPVYPV